MPKHRNRAQEASGATDSGFEMITKLIYEGYDFLKQRDESRACDLWLKGWEMLKARLTPEMTRLSDLGKRPADTALMHNWSQDLEMRLEGAAIDDPSYYEQRIRYCREFYSQFTGESDLMLLNFHRAEAESLWALGRHEEAESKFQEMTLRFPDQAWAYIAWGDSHWLGHGSEPEVVDYDRALAIYERALGNPQLEDRADVYERLSMLYEQKGEEDKADHYHGLEMQARNQGSQAQLPTPERSQSPQAQSPWPRTVSPSPREEEVSTEPVATPRAPEPILPYRRPTPKLGRNGPCWCGSGKKYKKCHLEADAAGKRGEQQ